MPSKTVQSLADRVISGTESIASALAACRDEAQREALRRQLVGWEQRRAQRERASAAAAVRQAERRAALLARWEAMTPEQRQAAEVRYCEREAQAARAAGLYAVARAIEEGADPYDAWLG